MYLLFPGRHHLLTDFQFKYIFRILLNKLEGETDVHGKPFLSEPIEGIIFAVTSANHSGTKRNPIPFYLRSMMIQEFSKELSVPVFVYGIDDVGTLDNFASYTIKSVQHQSDYRFELKPFNTVVICSTKVLNMYEQLGYRILPAELESADTWNYITELPWDLILNISTHEDWKHKSAVIDKIHTSSYKIWNSYQLDYKVRALLQDPIIGDDGDITLTRDYNTYVRQMDEIAVLKYKDTSPFIKSGRIGDIGCAVGSWIRMASEDNRFKESDFYGIEVARLLFDICEQRKNNGEFANPSVFFAKKNAVTGLVFQQNSMNTIHTSSLTHEIESYGNHQDLLDFIKNRFSELTIGGVWINRDVIGPEDGDKEVLMLLNAEDGSNEDVFKEYTDAHELSQHLHHLSTYSRFLRFAGDFRHKEKEENRFAEVLIEGKKYIRLSLRDAAEYMLTKDYTDNWESEMHERFCFWSYTDWCNAMKEVGFTIREDSNVYQNPWIVTNRWIGKAELVDVNDVTQKIAYPPTNMLMIAERIE